MLLFLTCVIGATPMHSVKLEIEGSLVPVRLVQVIHLENFDKWLDFGDLDLILKVIRVV